MIQDYYKAIEVYRNTTTIGQYGDVVVSESLNLTTTGLINGGTEAQQFIADKYQVTQQFNFYTDVGQDIKQDDVVKWIDGLKYRIVSNEKNTVVRNHHAKFLAVRNDSDV